MPEGPGERGIQLWERVEGRSQTGTRVELNWFRLKACVKCRGDLVWDDGDWLCLQCGRYYYTRLYQPEAIPDWQWRQGSGPRQDSGPRMEKATVLRPLPLHSHRAVESEPLASSPLGSRTASSAADALTDGMGFGSRPPAKR